MPGAIVVVGDVPLCHNHVATLNRRKNSRRLDVTADGFTEFVQQLASIQELDPEKREEQVALAINKLLSREDTDARELKGYESISFILVSSAFWRRILRRALLKDVRTALGLCRSKGAVLAYPDRKGRLCYHAA